MFVTTKQYLYCKPNSFINKVYIKYLSVILIIHKQQTEDIILGNHILLFIDSFCFVTTCGWSDWIDSAAKINHRCHRTLI